MNESKIDEGNNDPAPELQLIGNNEIEMATQNNNNDNNDDNNDDNNNNDGNDGDDNDGDDNDNGNVDENNQQTPPQPPTQQSPNQQPNPSLQPPNTNTSVAVVGQRGRKITLSMLRANQPIIGQRQSMKDLNGM